MISALEKTLRETWIMRGGQDTSFSDTEVTCIIRNFARNLSLELRETYAKLLRGEKP